MVYTYKYPRMLVTVDTLVFLREDSNPFKILLIRRKNNPFKGHHALPGGFVDLNELLRDAAARELYEETGLKGIDLIKLDVFDQLGRDPRDRNICIAFYGFTTSKNCEVKGGDDAENAEWVDLDNLPTLAFDHSEIINKARAIIGI